MKFTNSKIFFRSLCSKYSAYLLIIQICSLSWMLEGTLVPYGVKVVIDELLDIKNKPDSSVWGISMSVLFCLLIYAITYAMFSVSEFIVAKKEPIIKQDIRTQAYSNMLSKDTQFFAKYKPGGIATRIDDLMHSSIIILDLCIHTFIPTLIGVIVTITAFVCFNTLFAVIVIVWIVLSMAYTVITAQKCINLSATHSLAGITLYNQILDSLSNYYIIKLFGNKRAEISYINQYQDDERDKYRLALLYIAKVKMVLGVLYFLFLVVFLLIAELYSYINGWITVTDFLYIFNTAHNIGMMMWASLCAIPNLFTQLGIHRQCIEIFDEHLEGHTKRQISGPRKPLEVTKGEIEIRNVEFSYSGHSSLLKNFSLKIKANQKLGIVGSSGSGKSTIINLILNLLEPESGSVMIDGIDVRSIERDSLNKAITVIPQDSGLFQRSIIENITYGNEEYSKKELLHALEASHCDKFINNLPGKLDYILGGRGESLSFGQRQRVAIARAFLKNSRIIILDEATSALDTVTEGLIQDALSSIIKDRTAIVIAHRLSTITKMDRIIVMQDGEIIEDGVHEELLNKKGVYAKLWSMQIEGFLPSEEGEYEE